ncbi:hypothetical protein [Kaistia terrae]|uniref:Uncharacterized protein n=1 Tax=Kaistia terrae TaxID=537017 RepID=A0ABW0Q3C9_9HYPH|nr:hypothetical protein [Kaistia terrae]MCX5581154.1 hypothetical protein [Kaistia terrae]
MSELPQAFASATPATAAINPASTDETSKRMAAPLGHLHGIELHGTEGRVAARSTGDIERGYHVAKPLL